MESAVEPVIPDKYYTSTEAASIAGVARSTIWRDTQAGFLPYVVERKGTRTRKLYRGSILNRYRMRTLFIEQ